MSSPPDTSTLHSKLQRDGFAFVTAETMRQLLSEPQHLDDWTAFVASWSDLAPDTYLALRGRHRRRRHATYSMEANGKVRRESPQPHFQSLQHNALQGDIQRWFRPIRPAIADGASVRVILDFCRQLFGAMAPATQHWHVEMHQFRIEARVGEPGEPTPEGVHR